MKEPTMTRIFVAFLIGAAACHPSMGERCNPLLFEDECGSGLACTYPPNCGVAFCCPPPATTSVPMCMFPPYCSGDACCPIVPSTETEDDSSRNCLPCPADAGA
jgi:hypothetical protein